MFVSSLYVRPFVRVFVFSLVHSVVLWRGSVRACPFTSPPHKDVRANRVCALVPVSFILRTHLCLYPFDHLARAVISKTQRVMINESQRPTKTGNEPLLGKGSGSSIVVKPRVFSIPPYSLVQDPRGPAQVTHMRETSRHKLVNPT